MITPSNSPSTRSLFNDLEYIVNPNHSLIKLAQLIDWQRFENAFKPLYCRKNGRPTKPIRRMVALLMLKHIRNVSDEVVVAQWTENPYYQYFSGEVQFQLTAQTSQESRQSRTSIAHNCRPIGQRTF